MGCYFSIFPKDEEKPNEEQQIVVKSLKRSTIVMVDFNGSLSIDNKIQNK